MINGPVNILDGDTFVVSDRRGDIEASPSEPSGLFRDDTRHLSTWILSVDGKRPNVLSVENLRYHEAQHFLAPSTGTVYVDAPLSIVRRRSVHDGFQEEIRVINHAAEAREMTLRLDVDSDFADLFEVKDVLDKKGEVTRTLDGPTLRLDYRRERFVRSTEVRCDPAPELDGRGLVWKVRVLPREEWTLRLDVAAASGVRSREGLAARRAARREEVEAWRRGSPSLDCSWRALESTYARCVEDLAALRFYPLLFPEDPLPAAGLPWFMAVFGRDSLITSFQALPFMPGLARSTLKVLARHQGATLDPFRDEEPGKILHEIRRGEMTAFEERPHSPYFGSADSTPLFLVLLDEYERWSGDRDFARGLEFAARRALEWIDRHGDRDGDGYVEYERRNAESGLENQCWKDSWDSIRFADGRLAKLPRATCEIQGYVYDAKRRCARLAREIWGDPATAERLDREAAELKRRFNRDFWLDDREYFALALDGDKAKVDALTSNIGHLLWSGIVDDDKAEAVARHLMGERLFSGWGVRTMAQGDAYYNPIGYHVGTVWPHDTSIVAWGLRRYGFREEAARLSFAMLEAARLFDGRLPEAFAGYPRGMTGWPVEYPTACSPQAWATGAPLLLARTLLGLEPVGERLLVDPALPDEIERLEVLDIPGRWGRSDAVGRARPARKVG